VEFCSDELISLFKNTHIIAYPHLSIQSGSSKILKSMGRHYDGDTTRAVLEKLYTLEREDGIKMNIGADIIVGFPGETPEDFEQTRELVTKYHITQLHAFPFSAHMDHYSVPAGMYPDQVPNHIIQSRLRSLLETGKSATLQFATEQI
jgi:tRNA A37 methylthiotransferase MiaB